MPFTVLPPLPEAWRQALEAELGKPYFQKLLRFLEEEHRAHRVFPPVEDVFRALELTPLAEVKVVLLGQDPYHDEAQAHGLCFSVREGQRPPPSLRNIFKELESDLGVKPPPSGSLEHWARQGVLLLNTVLTVRAHQAHSHRSRGWESFTDAVLDAVNALPEPVVFVLWGGPAQKKAGRIDPHRHAVLQAPHPSPLSAHKGFFGSRPFSRVNAALRAHGRAAIDWVGVTTGRDEQAGR